MFFKEHWWLFGKLTPLRAAAPMLHICAQFSAQKSLDLSEVLDLSYERWQFSDFQGARTSWGTQNDLWKSRLLLPASQDINRYPIYPQVLGWMIRTPWNSYFVTKCHKCFVANPLVIVDPSMRASDFEMVPFLIHRAPLPHSIEELNLCSQAVSELHLLAGDTIFNTTSKVQGMYMLAAGDLSLC